MNAAVRGKGATRFYEVSRGLELTAKDYVRYANLPIIYIEESELKGEFLSSGLWRFVSVLNQVRENEPSLFSEISEIFYRGGRGVLRLKGRGQYYLVSGSREDFIRMKGAVAFIDRTGGRYSLVDLTQEPVFAR
jgi:hypothetical protein